MRNTVRISMALLFGFSFLVFAPRVSAQMERGDVDNDRASRGRGLRDLANEEELLKSAYDRLVLYVKAGNGFNAVQKSETYNPEDELSFELRDIRSGPIAEILQRPYTTFVTKPTGYVLKIITAQRS